MPDSMAFDSTTFFASFYSALLYYLLALATAPLWFKVIALNRPMQSEIAQSTSCSWIRSPRPLSRTAKA